RPFFHLARGFYTILRRALFVGVETPFMNLRKRFVPAQNASQNTLISKTHAGQPGECPQQ
ncbi:MAG TPA: hypothetical protein PKE57_11225, partial [Cellvibrionaceae bacterium]|nr:hypothetical protein [Cellvibrionaceae bacterium]